MNKMKFIVAAAIVGPALLASSAFAATISDPLFSNGQTSIDAAGGSTVNGTFTLTVGPGEVVEWLRTQTDTMPFTDVSVGGTLGYQEGVYTNVPFSAKVPPNTGTFDVNEQGAGIYGGNRSINGGDNVVVGPVMLGDVRVVANTGVSSGGTGGTWEDAIAALSAQIQALLHPAATTTSSTSAVCTAYAQAAAGSMAGTHNQANVRLQGFLLSQGASIPALAAGASFGFDGPQTESARAAFVSANHCN